MQPDTFKALLSTFALWLEADIGRWGDQKALMELDRLLDRKDPFILMTKDGPLLYALIRHFGLLPPHHGNTRLDELDPELVCRVLVDFEKWRLSVLNLQRAEEFFVTADVTYRSDRREFGLA